jgi:hypothetical protein
MRDWICNLYTHEFKHNYYKCEFGFVVKDLKYEHDSEVPFTPISGKVYCENTWIEGRWTETGDVMGFVYDIKWSLVQITKAEWEKLMIETTKLEPQMSLFEVTE